MEHIDLINKFFDLLICYRLWNLDISGYHYNVSLLKKKRNYQLIYKHKLKLIYYRCRIYLLPLQKSKTLLFHQQLFNNENLIENHYKTTLSWFTKLKLYILIRWDLHLKKCEYRIIKGKKILVYNDIKRIRL